MVDLENTWDYFKSWTELDTVICLQLKVNSGDKLKSENVRYVASMAPSWPVYRYIIGCFVGIVKAKMKKWLTFWFVWDYILV